MRWYLLPHSESLRLIIVGGSPQWKIKPRGKKVDGVTGGDKLSKVNGKAVAYNQNGEAVADVGKYPWTFTTEYELKG